MIFREDLFLYNCLQPPAYLMMDDNGSNSTLTGGGGVVFGGRKACDTVSESGIAACAGGRLPGGGFLNLRQYEEEVNKLRKETLSLRDQLYKNRSSRKIHSQRLFSRE